jgi:hypothetical protein
LDLKNAKFPAFDNFVCLGQDSKNVGHERIWSHSAIQDQTIAKFPNKNALVDDQERISSRINTEEEDVILVIEGNSRLASERIVEK